MYDIHEKLEILEKVFKLKKSIKESHPLMPFIAITENNEFFNNLPCFFEFCVITDNMAEITFNEKCFKVYLIYEDQDEGYTHLDIIGS